MLRIGLSPRDICGKTELGSFPALLRQLSEIRSSIIVLSRVAGVAKVGEGGREVAHFEGFTYAGDK